MKLRYALYIAVIVLINIAATTLFFRIDLTENRSYSLSQASKELVQTLEEPLSIKVFLSENLPVPYNTLERDIRDILMEYQLKANKHFNYTIHIIKKDAELEVDPGVYGISPVNIQNIEQDEVQVVSAYIGMTFIHGDLVETIPAIQYNQNLELTITDTIRTLTEKTTSLLSLQENIKVKLYISEILYQVSSDLKSYSSRLESIIDNLNSEYFNRIDFEFINPAEGEISSLQTKYDFTTLNLESSNGNVIKAIASLVTENGDEFGVTNLVGNDLFGRTTIADPEQLTDEIKSNIDKMIGAGTKIGYLTSNGTIPITQDQMAMFYGQQEPQISNLSSIINQDYTMSQVDLSDGKIPNDIKTLIIARPTVPFSDRELFLLDQFILKGNSVLLALDQFEMDEEKSNVQYGQEVYKLVDHGLTELLEHYGITVSENMVMDEKSFIQTQRNNQGSIIETQLYFAPLVQPENVNRELPFLKNVNELLTFRMAEVKATDSEDSTVKPLFSTTEKAWFSTLENLTMAPGRITPPADQSSYTLGVVKDSGFSSFYTNKPIPAKEFRESEDEETTDSISGVVEEESFNQSSDSGKIVVLGSSDLLTDSILTQNSQPNILFMQNTIDYLSDRGDYTLMRSKGVLLRPMVETTSAKRNFIKYFNIIGLPILVALAGLLAYILWVKKKKMVMTMFAEVNDEK